MAIHRLSLGKKVENWKSNESGPPRNRGAAANRGVPVGSGIKIGQEKAKKKDGHSGSLDDFANLARSGSGSAGC